MKKHDLATILARRARTSRASAADRIDRLIQEILTELKRGNAVSLPGLGRFNPGKSVSFDFESATRTGERAGEKKH